MSKHDKLIKRIFESKSDITPEEAVKILRSLGYKASPANGSHQTFRKPNNQSVTIVLTQNPIKQYMIDKLQETLRNEGVQNE